MIIIFEKIIDSTQSNTHNPNFRLKGTIFNFEISKMTKIQSSVGFDQDVVWVVDTVLESLTELSV